MSTDTNLPRLFCVMLLAAGLLSALPSPAQPAPRPTATPRMDYLDNGTIRLGVDLNLGGSITYLAEVKNPVNVVNCFDWGRQIQMSFYSGPVPFVSGEKKPAPAWAGLGWNPIQTGDYYGQRSRILEHTNDGRTLHVKCIPMQWPMNNVPGDCTFDSWITLEGNTVHVRARLANARLDKTQYPARDQELPAVYTNAPLYRLFTYTGDKPFTSDTLTQIETRKGQGFPWKHWEATEQWAALVRDDGWGLGVWKPGNNLFIGGFFGEPGRGGPKDNPTGYLSPVMTEILDANIRYDYEYVLILGRLDEIRHYVAAHAAPPAPPAAVFENDRQHWRLVNAADTGWPMRGEWCVKLEQADPQLIGPACFWQAGEAPRLYLRAAFHTAGTAAPVKGEVFWKRYADRRLAPAKPAPDFTGAASVAFDVIPDGQYHTYEIDLSASPAYRGAITGLRLDPIPAGRPTDWVKIRWLAFRKIAEN